MFYFYENYIQFSGYSQVLAFANRHVRIFLHIIIIKQIIVILLNYNLFQENDAREIRGMFSIEPGNWG